MLKIKQTEKRLMLNTVNPKGIPTGVNPRKTIANIARALEIFIKVFVVNTFLKDLKIESEVFKL